MGNTSKEKEEAKSKPARKGRSASVDNQDGARSRLTSQQKGKKKSDTGSSSTSLTVSSQIDKYEGDEDEDVMPDELTCKVCETVFVEDSDQLLQCERCDDWMCIQCTGLNEQQYDLLNVAKSKNQLHWYCNVCNEKAISAVRTDNDIEVKCKQYFDKVSGEINEVRNSLDTRITTEVSKLKDEIATIRGEIKQTSDGQLRAEFEAFKEEMKSNEARMGDKFEEKMNEATDASLSEFREREDRKLNLIIFNIPESKKEDGEDRQKDDLEALRILLAKLDLKVPLSNVIRLGTPGEKARPIRATTASFSDQKKILGVTAKLQTIQGYEYVFINRDMTPLERNQWKKLVVLKKQKQEKSKTDGEDVTWIIRGNKVVKGRPRREGAAEGAK